mmetsp:Transcript_55229/g.96746  ORF Transcript_55229/g.96746 Transcript_55229/m.96746 type:complete len:285 (-) Transcript_55229:1096-1950(-)
MHQHLVAELALQIPPLCAFFAFRHLQRLFGVDGVKNGSTQQRIDFFFLVQRTFPEGLSGLPMVPVRYSIVCDKLLNRVTLGKRPRTIYTHNQMTHRQIGIVVFQKRPGLLHGERREYLRLVWRHHAGQKQMVEIQRGIVPGGWLAKGVRVVGMRGVRQVGFGGVQTHHPLSGHKYHRVGLGMGQQHRRPGGGSEAVVRLLAGLFRAVNPVKVGFVRQRVGVQRDGWGTAVVERMLQRTNNVVLHDRRHHDGMKRNVRFCGHTGADTGLVHHHEVSILGGNKRAD